MSGINFENGRELDIIVSGRAGVDFNTMDLNCSFEDITGYTKSVGGSPANTVQGLAKLSVKTGFIGKISSNDMGKYIRNTFEKANIDTKGLINDKTGANNCIAITFIKSPEDSSSFLYRNTTADTLLESSDISEEYIKSAKCVLMSGTAFSTEPSRSAMFTIMELAKKNKTKVILDIDYRPYGWTSKEQTAECFSEALKYCDIVIGNREEFDAVEYNDIRDNKDNEVSAKRLLEIGAELVIIKDGSKGSVAITKTGEKTSCGIIKTKALKTYGSGDAYAAGFLSSLIFGESLEYSMKFGSAAASLALTAMSCSEGMPTKEEVLKHIENNSFSV